MRSSDGLAYHTAGPIIEDIATVQTNPLSDFNPLYQFRQDQLYTPPALHDRFETFDGFKIYVDHVWPFSSATIPLDDEDWLLDMWDATKAPGVGVVLFLRFKHHAMMDCIPGYLSNPAFMLAMGDELKKVMKSHLSGKIRNDTLYRYQRLLQTNPIMFETLDWLDDYWKDFFGTKLFKFGISNAFAFINPENITAEMIHEAVTSARANAAKRLVPPSDYQYIQMYEALLEYNGQDLVQLPELVTICLLSWVLGRRYIKAKNLSFNDALSVAMTFIYKRGITVSPYENHSLIEKLYEEYGPSDQWPSIQHVVQYVNASTSGRVQKTPPAPASGMATTSTRSSPFD